MVCHWKATAPSIVKVGGVYRAGAGQYGGYQRRVNAEVELWRFRFKADGGI
jgi:hypothetical protein